MKNVWSSMDIVYEAGKLFDNKESLKRLHIYRVLIFLNSNNKIRLEYVPNIFNRFE